MAGKTFQRFKKANQSSSGVASGVNSKIEDTWANLHDFGSRPSHACPLLKWEWSSRVAHHETKRIRNLARQPQEWQGNALLGQRGPQADAVFVQFTLWRRDGHESRGADCCCPCRVLHDGALCRAGRSGL